VLARTKILKKTSPTVYIQTEHVIHRSRTDFAKYNTQSENRFRHVSGSVSIPRPLRLQSAVCCLMEKITFLFEKSGFTLAKRNVVLVCLK